MVQLENEYGSYASATHDCSQVAYLSHLRDLARAELGDKVLLYTTDGPDVNLLRCATIPGVYPTVDFGPGADYKKAFDMQRHFAPRGPLVNSEFYTGWLDSWGSPHSKTSAKTVADALDKLLSYGANVNLYMVHGGTTFGFNSGANFAPFKPQVRPSVRLTIALASSFPRHPFLQPTSYDYDAPISESGDLTDKYFLLRDVIKKYLPLPGVDYDMDI